MSTNIGSESGGKSVAKVVEESVDKSVGKSVEQSAQKSVGNRICKNSESFHWDGINIRVMVD